MQPNRQCVSAFVVLLVCSLAFAAEQQPHYIEDTERFPGWKGELPKVPDGKEPLAPKILQHSDTIGTGEKGQETWRGEVVRLAWEPRAFLLKNFLSDEETDYLINKAQPHMVKSTVVDSDTGKSVDSTVRTSTGTFFARAEDQVIANIEQRIAHVSHIPPDNGEGLQILHYVDGQHYLPHHDYFHDSVNPRPENGGQRIATVLMYLTTVEEGGETVFPNSPNKVSGPEWSDCAKQGLAVKTRKGDALLFYRNPDLSLKPNGEKDNLSLHGSCATVKGEKWSATKWLHVAPFGRSSDYQKAKWGGGGCIDEDHNCPNWALTGECEKNPAYMRTSCRLSCKLCPKIMGAPQVNASA